MNTSETSAWAAGLAASKAVVIHSRGVIGRVVEYFPPGTFQRDKADPDGVVRNGDGGPVTCDVVKLDTGDAFVVKREDFIVVTPGVEAYLVAMSSLTESIADGLVKSACALQPTIDALHAVRVARLLLLREAKKIDLAYKRMLAEQVRDQSGQP